MQSLAIRPQHKLLLGFTIIAVLVLSAFFMRIGELQGDVQRETPKQQHADLIETCKAKRDPAEQAQCLLNSRTEKHELFDELMQHSNLVSILDDGRLQLPPRDYLLALRASGQSHQIDSKTHRLFTRLYHSTAGHAVQKQVRWWNHSRQFAAIRDNVKQDERSQSHWNAYDEWEGVLAGRDNVPLEYGYINAGKIPTDFNNWLSITGSDTVIFQRTVDPRQQKQLSLQVIGYPDISQLNAHKKNLEACWRQQEGQAAVCKSVDTPLVDTDMYRIHIKLATNQPQKLIVPVKPTQNQQAIMDGLSIRLKDSAQIGHYQPQDYLWSPIYDHVGSTTQRTYEQFNYRLTTAEGTLLFDSSQNQPSDFSQDNGLLALIGYDNTDRTALAGMVANTTLQQDDTEIRLSLREDFQKIAQRHLEQELKVLDPDKRFQDVRRAAVILMKPQSGAILAAANYPKPPSNVNRWDRLSFSKLYPSKDKFLVPAWQGLDNNNTPGSVFKLVTALAGLQAAEEGNDAIKSLLRGLKAKAFQRLTGLSVETYSYQPDQQTTTKVHNASNVPLLAAMPHKAGDKKIYPALRSTQGADCPARASRSKDLGLREATRDSLNVWFARLGVMLDGDSLSTGKDAQLVRMAQQLGFGQKIALAPVGTPLNRHGNLTKHKGRGTVLSGFSGDLTLHSESSLPYAQGSALQRLTQNSFGQGIATTPLQIAKVAATIATGEMPQPYLLQQWGNSHIKPPKTQAFKLDDLDLLREGMKAVPEVGTAKKAFRTHYPAGKCRTYGKTGTAQVVGGSGKRSRYSAWFTGWIEDKQGEPSLAFACMITHTYKKGHSYGGDTCAPVIARILRDIEASTPQENL